MMQAKSTALKKKKPLWYPWNNATNVSLEKRNYLERECIPILLILPFTKVVEVYGSSQTIMMLITYSKLE